MIFRNLTANEIPLCYEGGKLFLEEAKFPEPFNQEAFQEFWRAAYLMGMGEILAVLDDEQNQRVIGALGYALSKCPFTGTLTALEQFWWVCPQHRKNGVARHLVENFERIAKEQGAKRLAMVHLAGWTLSKVFEARGYKLCEQTFWKEI